MTRVDPSVFQEETLVEWLNADAGYFFRAGRRLAHFRSAWQDIEVYDTPAMGRLFRLDGSFMTSERDEFFYHENMVHLAAVCHPGPVRALVVGGGDGGSTEELLKHPGLQRVIMAELDPGVIEIARQHLGTVHRGAFDDPRLEVRIGDGLSLVRESAESFDLIVLDLTDPGGPSEPLYTEDFYRACHARLAPGGAMTLHVGSPVMHPQRFAATLARLARVFACVRPYLVFIPLYGTWWGMACCSDALDPLAFVAAEVDAEIARRGLTDLRFYNGAMHQAVLALPNFVRELLPQP